MTTIGPLQPTAIGSSPPIGFAPFGRSESGVEEREDNRTLPGRASPDERARAAADGTATNGTATNGSGSAEGAISEKPALPPIQPGRPLIGGGPFTLAVAFGLQADQQAQPEIVGSADTPDEAVAALEAEEGAEDGAVGGQQLTEEEQEVVRDLKKRDQEVRQHEAAHAATGGQFAGSPTYTYQAGPDGRRYAVGGEVSIDVSPVEGDPQATAAKARQIRAAALAPADPSSQDRSVAAAASALERQAQAEISAERTEQQAETTEEGGDAADPSTSQAAGAEPADRSPPAPNTGSQDVPQGDGAGSAAAGPQTSPFSAFPPNEDADDGFGIPPREGSSSSPSPYLAPRSFTGFDGRAPASQLISIAV